MGQIVKKIRQLEIHVAQLREEEVPESSGDNEPSGEFAKYLMPSDISFPVDWTEFDNVYQGHCPKFRFVCDAILVRRRLTVCILACATLQEM